MNFSETSDPDGNGGGGGKISPGGKAALVIFLLIVPVGCAAAIVGWIVWRKHSNKPVIPEKLSKFKNWLPSTKGTAK